ncbi:hypothetical protein HH800_28845 (plasmid) [Sphingobium yanoikuyae]|uniref:Tetratricopeptide repeat protein n=1 Tax=Sphingobium yanoikuyae TaxID=13690 RepID=A0A6M4GG06_SPHYA|nr:hypothetical protein [Sphingobium yanoikuyae]QJR06232.1 hypothetical protein HH800_28845 [Sphingobium yanoikuyae]
MKEKTSRQRRSPLEWSVRLILAGIAAWLGYLSVMQSVALVLPDSRIEEAYALASNNGHIAGRLSQTLYRSNASEADRIRAVAIARDALHHDPTAVEAVATLAADAFVRGDQAEGERLLAYSQTLSRRDLRTQLMAIELAVARDDIPGALRHYDIALRTKKKAPDLLYPVLASALTDPAIRAELIKTLGGQPNWGNGFINHAARSDADPVASAAFFRALQIARVSVPDSASVALINRLLAAKLFDDAWSYYAAARPGSERHQSRDPAFTSPIEARSAFDWIAINSIGVSTAILSDPANGLFDFTVSMGNGGLLLQQLQMLPPGEYVLKGHSIGIEQAARSRPYWVVRCQTGSEIGRVEVPNSSQTGGRFQGHVNIPTDCPVQTLALIARSSNEIGGVSGQIDRILIRPTRPQAPERTAS